MRAVLLNATIKCLFDHGYGATTTIKIAKQAGVSRGAILNHFPSKADLMIFVVETGFEEQIETYAQMRGNIGEPHERLTAYLNAVWNVLSRPSGVAVLEILQGSRSDSALREKLVPIQARIDAYAEEILTKDFPRLSGSLLQLIVGAARGLSVRRVMPPEGENPGEAVKLLQRLLKAGIKSGVLSGNRP